MLAGIEVRIDLIEYKQDLEMWSSMKSKKVSCLPAGNFWVYEA